MVGDWRRTDWGKSRSFREKTFLVVDESFLCNAMHDETDKHTILLNCSLLEDMATHYERKES